LALRTVSVIGFQLMRRSGAMAGCGRHELGDDAARHRQHQADERHRFGTVEPLVLRQIDQHAAEHVAQQDRDEGAHLDHAVATGQLTLVQMLRQVGVLHRTEDRAVQSQQKDARQKQRHLLGEQAQRHQDHDRDLEGLDPSRQRGFIVLVGQLPRGRREQEKGQDEHRADDKPCLLGFHPVHADLVRHQHRERELEDVVVHRTEELRPEERREATLAQQRELIGVGGRAHGVGVIGFAWFEPSGIACRVPRSDGALEVWGRGEHRGTESA
jgi:hypothetical protein